MALPSVSVQLYSVRHALESDPSGTIDRIARIGFTQVEAGFKYLTAHPELLDAIQRNGLGTPTMTASLFEVADRTPVWDLARRLGATTVSETFVPEQHWTSIADVDHIAGELNSAAAEAAAHGLNVAYHNHWWELETRFEGRTAFDLLIDRLDPGVVLEVDAYWVAVGGVDPVEFVAAHADRVRFLHLKDGPISRDNAEQRPAGQGSLPIAALVDAAPLLRAGVVEFDEYPGDVFAAIAESLAYLSALLSTSAART